MKSVIIAVAAGFLLMASGDQAQTTFADLKRPSNISDAEHTAKMEEIDALVDQAMDMLMAAVDPDTQDRIADHAKAAEAVLVFEKALSISETWLGEGPFTSVVLSNVAFAYNAVGRKDEAIAAYERANRIWLILYGPDDAGLISNASNLGYLYLEGGRFAEAEASFHMALRCAEKGEPDDREMIPSILGGLAELYDKMGRTAEAEAMRKRAAAIPAN